MFVIVVGNGVDGQGYYVKFGCVGVFEQGCVYVFVFVKIELEYFWFWCDICYFFGVDCG